MTENNGIRRVTKPSATKKILGDRLEVHVFSEDTEHTDCVEVESTATLGDLRAAMKEQDLRNDGIFSFHGQDFKKDKTALADIGLGMEATIIMKPYKCRRCCEQLPIIEDLRYVSKLHSQILIILWSNCLFNA